MDASTDRITVSSEEEGMRLDRVLTLLYPDHSRSFFQKLIENGNVTVNEAKEKPSKILTEDDVIEVAFPEPEELNVLPEDIPLDVLYEDDDVILINKPKGMVVHPAAGHFTGTLVNALLYHCHDLSGINGVIRPGIVHRIDRDTTGVLIVCKNDEAHLCLAKQLKEHSVHRIYVGLVNGILKEDEGTLSYPIGRHPTDRKKMAVRPDGKEAVTHYRVLKRYDRYTLSEFRLETGRTHQIRVHMAKIGHPLVGDEVYGTGKCEFKTDGQMLHARTFGFIHPRTGKYMEFESPLPEYFETVLKTLERRA